MIKHPNGSVTINGSVLARRYKRSDRVNIYGVFICQCGSWFDKLIQTAFTEDIDKCPSCTKRKEHGLDGTSLYHLWQNIKKRCYDTNNPAYARYGGRGIKMYSLWVNDFPVFLDYISTLQNFKGDGLTLDRIDNDNGYYPNNLRWADKVVQASNRGVGRNNKSGYTGVIWNKKDRLWVVYLTHRSKRKYMGGYKTKEEAIASRNEYIKTNNLPHTIQEQVLKELIT